MSQGLSRGHGGGRRLLATVALCALASNVFARDGDRLGMRLNTGLGRISPMRYLEVGGGLDTRLAPGLALVIDGQKGIGWEEEYWTLTAGLQARVWPTETLCPYLTVAGGISTRYPEPQPGQGAVMYAYVGLGAYVRLSRSAALFGEVRPKLYGEGSGGSRVGTAGLIGIRLGF